MMSCNDDSALTDSDTVTQVRAGSVRLWLNALTIDCMLHQCGAAAAAGLVMDILPSVDMFLKGNMLLQLEEFKFRGQS